MPVAVAAVVRDEVGPRLRQVDEGAAHLHVMRNIAVDAVEARGCLVHKPILEAHINGVDEHKRVLAEERDHRQLRGRRADASGGQIERFGEGHIGGGRWYHGCRLQ